MPASRQTFLVQVHDDGGAVLENVRTRECIWLSGLSEVGVQIASWLEEPLTVEDDRSPPAGRAPLPGSSTGSYPLTPPKEDRAR